MDIATKNFLINSGSYFVFVLGIIVWSLVRRMVQWCAFKNYRHKRAREMGIKVYDP